MVSNESYHENLYKAKFEIPKLVFIMWVGWVVSEHFKVVKSLLKTFGRELVVLLQISKSNKFKLF